MATMISATSDMARDTRSPTSGPCMNVDTEESCVEPASSDTVNTIISMAGSASEAIIISRLEPMPPKLVPISSPANARAKRALPSSATIAMRSAAGLNTRPVAKVGTSAAAINVVAKMMSGADRNTQEALSASTTSLRISLSRSR